MERKKVCSLMDCQKLSREACAHAAQNDRLPLQTVVQVLYYEQQRLQDTMNETDTGRESPALPKKMAANSNDHDTGPKDLASLQRENEDLKLELARMRMRLKELERPAVSRPSADKPPLPRKSFMNTVSKKLGRLYPFVRADGMKPSKPSKDRRHSIS